MFRAMLSKFTWLLLIVFNVEVLAFILLPDKWTSYLWPYRCQSCVLPPGAPIGRMPFPRFYFTNSSELGFDIASNVPPSTHHFGSEASIIWSNQLGCFDTDDWPEGSYAYLAGDSYTWGYAPFPAKFGTLVEQMLDIRILKCGVPHTGQLHQLTKLKQTIERIGHPPDAIIVALTPNDIANDLAHPHSTVLNGYLLDFKHLYEDDHGWVVRPTARNRLDQVARLREPDTRTRTVADHILFQLRKISWLAAFLSQPTPARWVKRYGVPVYRRELWEKDGVFWYHNNLYADRNKTAIREIARVASDSGATLLLLLIPGPTVACRSHYFAEMNKELSDFGIITLDFSVHIQEEGIDCRSLYWSSDPHLSYVGNLRLAQFLAPMLARSMKKYRTHIDE